MLQSLFLDVIGLACSSAGITPICMNPKCCKTLYAAAFGSYTSYNLEQTVPRRPPREQDCHWYTKTFPCIRSAGSLICLHVPACLPAFGERDCFHFVYLRTGEASSAMGGGSEIGGGSALSVWGVPSRDRDLHQN